jgi:hypothetical protein
MTEINSMHITIADLQGKELFNSEYRTQSSSLLSIDIDNLKSGMYFVTVINKDYLVTRKFIKL